MAGFVQGCLPLFKSEAAIKLLELGIVCKRNKSFKTFAGHSVYECVNGEVTHTLISESGGYGKGPEFNGFGIDIELFHTAYDDTVDL